MSDIVIEMTPFIYENGKTYYFEICKRSGTNEYHNIYVYKKVVTKRNFLWWKWEKTRYDLMNQENKLVFAELDTDDIKGTIKSIMPSNIKELKDWDGFVGNVPDDIKKALQRDSKLDELLGS
jgi:hypothetical protein